MGQDVTHITGRTWLKGGHGGSLALLIKVRLDWVTHLHLPWSTHRLLAEPQERQRLQLVLTTYSQEEE